MKKTLFAAAAAAALLTAGAASAEGSLSYNVAVTSDYVWRGITQNDEEPALQAGIDYSAGIFYAGAWASNVVEGADVEVDLYAGFKPTAGDFSFDLGVIHYAYTGDDELNFTEVKGAVSYPVGTGSMGIAYYTPTEDTFDTYYVELNGAFPITEKLSVSGAIGKQEFADVGSYDTWNLGGTYAITDVFSVDLRYHDTSEDIPGFDERVAVTLKAAF